VTRPGRIWIAGGKTLVGAALRRRLAGEESPRLVVGPEPDLLDRGAVDHFLGRTRPELVVVAAGPSGGIAANQRRPATLMQQNLLVACHVLDAAHRHGVRKLLYLGSSCTYPRDTAQPMAVDALLSGPLEPTSRPYALAKLAGMALCDAYRREHRAAFVAAIPADVYGPDDAFSAEDSHVVGALVRRLVDATRSGASEVEIWGTGEARRDLVYADDIAEACLAVLAKYNGPGPINLGSGADVSIRTLAETLRDVTGFQGALRFDPSRPDGMPRKALDGTALAALGWTPRTSLRDGLATTVAAYRAQAERAAAAAG
jgi:GDP-L-fucose synthase